MHRQTTSSQNLVAVRGRSDIKQPGALGELGHLLKCGSGAVLRSLLLGKSSMPLLSRVQWMQRGYNLALLAGAMCLGFSIGLQELAQGHLGWAAGWWLVMPVTVLYLAFGGLKRILVGDGCLPSARSNPVLGVTANQPVDFRRYRVGALPRARDSIP